MITVAERLEAKVAINPSPQARKVEWQSRINMHAFRVGSCLSVFPSLAQTSYESIVVADFGQKAGASGSASASCQLKDQIHSHWWSQFFAPDESLHH